MALVDLGGMPLTAIGMPSRQGWPHLGSMATIHTADALNECCQFIGQIWTTDGQSHTIDTTGSSRLLWHSALVTFANSGTTLKVGLGAVDTTGPAPARAVNVAGVATTQVSSAVIGGSGAVTANTWISQTPDTGSMTIANGDLVAMTLQLTSRAGTDSIAVQGMSAGASPSLPCSVTYVPTTYSLSNGLPCAVIQFRDGTRGYFFGSFIIDFTTNNSYNNAGATREYGNLFRFPVPTRIWGAALFLQPQANFDVVVYTNPFAVSPIPVKSLSVLAAQMGSNTYSMSYHLFPAPLVVPAETEIVVAMKPTTGTSINLVGQRFFDATHQESDLLGTRAYGVSRGTAAFSMTNAGLDRYCIGPLVGAFEHPAQSDFILGL